jgi:hypothetical protein
MAFVGATDDRLLWAVPNFSQLHPDEYRFLEIEEYLDVRGSVSGRWLRGRLVSVVLWLPMAITVVFVLRGSYS